MSCAGDVLRGCSADRGHVLRCEWERRDGVGGNEEKVRGYWSDRARASLEPRLVGCGPVATGVRDLGSWVGCGLWSVKWFQTPVTPYIRLTDIRVFGYRY
jgi:hypothetical protein